MKLIAKHIGLLFLILLTFVGLRMSFGLASYCAIPNRITFGFIAYVLATCLYLRSRVCANLSLEMGAIFQNVLLMVIIGYAFSLFIDYFIIWFVNASLAEEMSIAFFNFNAQTNELFGMSPVEKARVLANFEPRPAAKYTVKSFFLLLFFGSLIMALPFALIVSYISKKIFTIFSQYKFPA